MPYMHGPASLALLGADDDAGTLAPAVAAWQARVRAQGGVPSRMPQTRDALNAGKLAARFGGAGSAAPSAPVRYELADGAALAADGRGAAAYASAIAAGKRVEDIEKSVALFKAGAVAALDLPRQAAAGILGIPPWLVTVALLGGAALVVKTLLPSLPGLVVRRNPPRKARRRKGRARR